MAREAGNAPLRFDHGTRKRLVEKSKLLVHLHRAGRMDLEDGRVDRGKQLQPPVDLRHAGILPARSPGGKGLRAWNRRLRFEQPQRGKGRIARQQALHAGGAGPHRTDNDDRWRKFDLVDLGMLGHQGIEPQSLLHDFQQRPMRDEAPEIGQPGFVMQRRQQHGELAVELVARMGVGREAGILFGGGADAFGAQVHRRQNPALPR
jgi:hypothetical protein